MFVLFSIIIAIISTILSYFLLTKEWYYLILACVIGFLLGFVIIFLFCTFLNLFQLRKKTVIKPKKIYSFFIYHCTKFLVWLLRIKVIYEGSELIKDLKGFEYISNHQSMVDPVVAISKFKRPDIAFIMKKEIMKVFTVGPILKNAGYYPIDRKNPRVGIKSILDGAQAIEAGRPIGVYIEGTRSKGPNIGEFHDGAIKMAMKAKSDIVVGVIDNSYNLHKRFPFRKTTILIKICEVLKYDDFKDKNTKEIGEEIHLIMTDNLVKAREKYNNYQKKK